MKCNVVRTTTESAALLSVLAVCGLFVVSTLVNSPAAAINKKENREKQEKNCGQT